MRQAVRYVSVYQLLTWSAQLIDMQVGQQGGDAALSYEHRQQWRWSSATPSSSAHAVTSPVRLQRP